jgi:hypothetical protein
MEVRWYFSRKSKNEKNQETWMISLTCRCSMCMDSYILGLVNLKLNVLYAANISLSNVLLELAVLNLTDVVV